MDTSQFKNTLEYPVFSGQTGEEFNIYFATLENYCLEDHRQYLRFKEALFKHLDIVYNPRREVLFSKCWELGHADGLDKVVYWAETLVSIIK